MKQRIFLALGAFVACASILLLGACERHDKEETLKHHQPHGHHDDAGHEADEAKGDPGGDEKKPH